MQNLLHRKSTAVANPTEDGLVPLSQSKFEAMGCAHLYAEEFIHGRKSPDNEYSLRGRQLHEGASHYVNHLVAKRLTSDQTWFAENILSRPYLPEALELLAALGDRYTVDPEKVLDTELWLPLDEDLNPLDVEPGDPLVAHEGTLDLVILTSPTSVDIDDLKSHYQIFDADTYQSKKYPLLLMKHFQQIETVRFRLRFIRYGDAERFITYSRADLPYLERTVRQARLRQRALHKAAANGEHMEATPGRFCAYCPKLQKGCPIADINPYTNQTPEDRLKFAIWVNEAKKQNDHILKDLVDASGPICIADANGKGYQADFQLQHRGSYSATVLPVVNANAPELVERLTVGGLSNWLKAKSRMALKGLCEPHRTEKTITKFTIHGVDLADEADADAAD